MAIRCWTSPPRSTVSCWPRPWNRSCSEEVREVAVTDLEERRKIYEDTKTIAVVGASAAQAKAAHPLPRYLQAHGFRIIPVNPRGGEILGEKAFELLTDIPESVDVVDVFRPSEET